MIDKILHFIVGFILSMIGIIWLPFILLGFIFGVGKEVYDNIFGGTVETNDMITTFLGAAMATIIVVIISYV